MIPLEDFFRKPDKIMLRLSPGGDYQRFLLKGVLTSQSSCGFPSHDFMQDPTPLRSTFLIMRSES